MEFMKGVWHLGFLVFSSGVAEAVVILGATYEGSEPRRQICGRGDSERGGVLDFEALKRQERGDWGKCRDKRAELVGNNGSRSFIAAS
ncbi:hypothetical protein BDQ17DRAFT_1355520 [Cyathus striatus]|nr:hypothetical protein BDQ17DRAFT_1355520 [Cyathus striatus]